MSEKTSIADILTQGKKVRIETVNHYGNKIITGASVLQMDETHITLTLPGQVGIFEQVNTNADVKLFCKKEDSSSAEVLKEWDYELCGRFIKVREVEPPELIVTIPVILGEVGASQTVECLPNLPFSYFINDKEIKGGIVKKLTPVSLTAFVKEDKALEIGLGLSFRIFLPNNANPLLSIGTITDLSLENDNCRMTLDFSHAPQDLQDQITRYLFSLPKAIVKKEQPSKPLFIKIN
jgi:hypothetical protein